MNESQQNCWRNVPIIQQQVHFRVDPDAENRRASQPVARRVIVKISVTVRRRLIATGSFCQSFGVRWTLYICVKCQLIILVSFVLFLLLWVVIYIAHILNLVFMANNSNVHNEFDQSMSYFFNFCMYLQLGYCLIVYIGHL